jgi:hypothetical protein
VEACELPKWRDDEGKDSLHKGLWKKRTAWRVYSVTRMKKGGMGKKAHGRRKEI